MFRNFSHEFRGWAGRSIWACPVASCSGGLVNAPCSAEAQNATSAKVQMTILSKRTIPPAPPVVINPQRQRANISYSAIPVKAFQSPMLGRPNVPLLTWEKERYSNSMDIFSVRRHTESGTFRFAGAKFKMALIPASTQRSATDCAA